MAALAGVGLATARELLVETDWAAEGSTASAAEFTEWLARSTDEDIAIWLRLMVS